MIKLEKTEVVGWEAAIRGMRNPMNSWEKSDSGVGCNGTKCTDCGRGSLECYYDGYDYIVGQNDHDLMMKLANAGTDHRKFMRMIVVYVDITAPLYWWKEFDTYKVGTVANSCSTMHKIHEKEFTLEDFSCEYLVSESIELLEDTINKLNKFRDYYDNYDKKNVFYIDNDQQIVDKKVIWEQMIQLLPSSYNQKRTVMFNYEVLANMYKSRNNHKLDEWRELCIWIEELPYSELITGEKKDLVEVTRCKNCKHFMTKEEMMNDEVYKKYEGLNLDGLCMVTDAFVNENEFCSYGQRVSKEE